MVVLPAFYIYPSELVLSLLRWNVAVDDGYTSGSSTMLDVEVHLRLAWHPSTPILDGLSLAEWLRRHRFLATSAELEHLYNLI
ncbi:hypothetical protein BT96DRAFT_929381 [Gymnopus androsaceus JB14]|uniref:Uncharacterized protein n=1 Tax=Gymnopus androsaceus JB14 TaxID=1447944 RepID=A0A6A4GFN4_9AGAR|nr:hypothetical protein BT96DRAFT_929381 [Gymnopus androsaceus JB14]